ncbi:uncharacterized protein LOC144496856 isoform X2 [Mustelus asterias]
MAEHTRWAEWPHSAPNSSGQSGMKDPSLVGAIGSSILLPGFSDEDYQNVHHVEWTISGRKILNYYTLTEVPTFTDSYKNRCTFNNANGSLLLRNITLHDRGLYQVQINLNRSRVQMIRLNVIAPLGEPLIFSNSTFVDTAIGFVCRVFVGKASSMLWWKDDRMIRTDERHQLTADNSTMVIYKAIKSDCGIYTCTVENDVSQKNTSHPLAIYGLPPPLNHARVLSIIALVSAAAVVIGIILLCLHHDTERIDIGFQRNALLFLQFAAMLSFIILFAALMCWLQVEEMSQIPVFMLVVLCLLLIFTIISTCSMNESIMRKFKEILNSKFCRITLDTVTPMGGVIVVCGSGLLLVEINKLAGKGCEPLPNLQSSIALAVTVPVFIFIFIFAVYVLRYKKHRKERQRGSPPENQNEDPEQPQRSEEVSLNEVPEADGSLRTL